MIYAKHNIYTLLILVCFCTSAAAASVSPDELKAYNKRLTTKDPKEVKTLVAEIAQRRPAHPLIINGLHRFLGRESVDCKIDIAQTLAILGDNTGITYLSNMLESATASEHDKKRALIALGKTESRFAVPILEAYCPHEDPSYTLIAIEGLIALHTNPSAATLSDIYASFSAQNRAYLVTLLAPQARIYTTLLTRIVTESSYPLSEKALSALLALADFNWLDTIEDNLDKVTDEKTKALIELYLIEHSGRHHKHFIEIYKSLSIHGKRKIFTLLAKHKETLPTAIEQIRPLVTQTKREALLFEVAIDPEAYHKRSMEAYERTKGT